MKRNIITKISLILCSAFLFSCSGFLKEVSQDEFEPKSATSFSELLNGSGYNFSGTALDGLTPYMSDDVTQYHYQYLTEAQSQPRDIYSWQPDMFERVQELDYRSANIYEETYARIVVCNMVIQLTPDASGSQSEKNQVIGEALALRAFYYLHLVNSFARPYNDSRGTPDSNPGVVLTLKSEVLDYGLPRNSVREVYDQIVKDVERAIELLDHERNDLGVFKFNYLSARVLASRIYLYIENWDKVIEHTTEALKWAPNLCYLPGYELYSSNPNHGPPQQKMNNINNVISRLFPETLLVFQGLIDPGMPFGLSDELRAMFAIHQPEGNDERRGKYFIETTDPDYSTLLWNSMSIKSRSSEMGYVFRTAELYLNRAEAYAMKYKNGDGGSGQLAIDDLNTLRSNRFTDYVNSTLGSADELVQFCRDERRRELFSEGHRWNDLRRYGMPSITHVWYDAVGNTTTYVLREKDPAYVMPIPQRILDRNNKLIQNELAPLRPGN